MDFIGCLADARSGGSSDRLFRCPSRKGAARLRLLAAAAAVLFLLAAPAHAALAASCPGVFFGSGVSDINTDYESADGE